MTELKSTASTKLSPLGGAALGAIIGGGIAVLVVWALDGTFVPIGFAIWAVPMSLVGAWVGGRLVEPKPKPKPKPKPA